MKPLRLPGFIPSPLRWAQLLWRRLHTGQPSPGCQPPALRIHVVRIGAAGTAYPATLREETRGHRGGRSG